MSYIPSINSVYGSDREIALNGASSYSINGDRVVIEIDEIANNRWFDNVSGTLAIELWALPQPYAGDQFNGVSLAATTIGEVCGQHLLPQCRYDLVFNQPPAGSWNLCLMLREWDNGAFVTRDYINFAVPYVVEENAQNRGGVRVSRDNTNNVINVAFKDEPQAPVKGMDEVIAKTPAARTTRAPAEKPAAKTAPAGKTAATKAAPAAKMAQVSINQASLKELESLTGVSKKLAKAIIDSRPYKKLDDLLKVKGMGKRLLDKLEKSLKI